VGLLGVGFPGRELYLYKEMGIAAFPSRFPLAQTVRRPRPRPIMPVMSYARRRLASRGFPWLPVAPVASLLCSVAPPWRVTLTETVA